MLRIVGVMRQACIKTNGKINVYLFDAQNRWGYEYAC